MCNSKIKPVKIKFHAVIIASALLMLLSSCSSLGKNYITDYEDPWHKKIAAAGIEEKQARVGPVNFNYAEGPDNGPALLLLNAQHMDWYSYSRVLPQLSLKFHLFALDYQGHGKTTYPEDYPLNANQIGNDIAGFIDSVIQEEVFVTGNSSGGLLTVWLAANRPDIVKAVILEDPPLFSSEYPRIKNTISYRSFTTCHNYLTHNNNGGDFLIYWLNSNSKFVANYAGEGALPKIISAVELYRKANPGEPVEIRFLPETVRMLFRGMDYYDPRFGAAFYDGSWNTQFDHAQTLAKIACPSLLLHADFEILEDGTLNGAMDQNEADRAAGLIPGCSYVRINSGHVVHEDKPKEFIQIVENFFLNIE